MKTLWNLLSLGVVSLVLGACGSPAPATPTATLRSATPAASTTTLPGSVACSHISAQSPVILRLSDALPTRTVTLPVGLRIRVIGSYGGNNLTLIRASEGKQSLCRLEEHRLAHGGVEATYVTERPGRVVLFSTLAKQTDAGDPILRGQIVVRKK